MKKEIIARIKDLGGEITQNESLQKTLESIRFQHPIYPHELWGEELYGIDDFYENHISEYQNNKTKFYDNLIAHFYANESPAYGQVYINSRLFTPLTEGTRDYNEWFSIFEDEDMTDLSEVRNLVGAGNLEFIHFAFSNGYPDGYYICLSDPNPENPTVFGTDHEVFFSEISNEGNLEDFLKPFYTKDEFIKIVKDYIETEISK